MPKRVLTLLSLCLSIGVLSCGDDGPTSLPDPVDDDPIPAVDSCLNAVVGLRVTNPTHLVWEESEDGSVGELGHFAGELVTYTVTPSFAPSAPSDCSYTLHAEVAQNSRSVVTTYVLDNVFGFRLFARAEGRFAVRLQLERPEGLAYTSDWVLVRVASPLRIGGVEVYSLDGRSEELLYRNFQSESSVPGIFLRENEDRRVRIVLLDGAGRQVPERIFDGAYSLLVSSSDRSIVQAIPSTESPTEYRFVSAGEGNGWLSFEVKYINVTDFVLSDVPAFVGFPRWSLQFSGENTPNGPIDGAVVHDDHLVVAGRFDRVGDVRARNIARWDGDNWFPLGEGIDEASTVMAQDDQLLVGRPDSGFKEWSGTKWIDHSPAVPGGSSSRAATLFNGEVYAGANVSRWNGQTWSSQFDAVGFEGATAFASHEGELYVAARFDRFSEEPRRYVSVATLSIGPPTIWHEVFRRSSRHGFSFMKSVSSGLVVAWFVNGGYAELIQGVTHTTLAENIDTVVGATDLEDDLIIADHHHVYSRERGFDAPIGRVTSPGEILGAVTFQGQLIVVGSFQSIDGVPSPYIALWTDR